MRVYELAKELGFSSKDLVSVLKDAGIVVSSHMSMISEQDVDKARKAAKPGKPAVAKSVTGEISVIEPPVLVAVPLTAMYLPTWADVKVNVVLVAPEISVHVEGSVSKVQATH